MMETQTFFAVLQEHKSQIQDRFCVKRIGLIGSYARGTQTKDSDIDIVVEFTRRNLLNRLRLQDYLTQLLAKPVDIVSLGDHLPDLLLTRIETDVTWIWP